MGALSSVARAAISLVVLVSVCACGGRTEVLRQQRVAASDPADAGFGDAPLFEDATAPDVATALDADVRDDGIPSDAVPTDLGALDASPPADAGCTEPVVARPLVTPEPGAFSAPFRAVIDQTHFYWSRDNGRTQEVLRRPISGGGEEILDLVGAEIVNAHSGRLLVNYVGRGERHVGIWSPQRFIGFNDGRAAELRDGVDRHLLSGQVAAWRLPGNRLSINASFDWSRAIITGGVVAGPEVFDDRVYWVERNRDVQLKSSRLDNIAAAQSISFPSIPDWMSAGATKLALVANGQPYIWNVAQGRVDQVANIPGTCVASVSSRTEHAFLCSEDLGNSLEIYREFNRRGVRLPGLIRGNLGSVDFEGRFLAYVRFPEGEGFCPGGSQGMVNVFDTVTQQTLTVGSVVAPCLCCDRIGHLPRVQVFDDVVMWTGERSATELEFAAVRLEQQCD